MSFSGEPRASKERLKDSPDVLLKRSQLALMAADVIAIENPQAQRDFTRVTLGVLQQTYRNELKRLNAGGMKATFKLIRWQRATADYVTRINQIQRLISTGHDFNLLITREGWLLIKTGDQQVLVTGPGGSDRVLASMVITEFCQLYDCPRFTSFSTARDDKRVIQRSGIWVFEQKSKPVFNIDQQYHFSFKNSQHKMIKQRMAYAAVADINHLLDALRSAVRQGHTVNWQQLQQPVNVVDLSQTKALNNSESYFTILLSLVKQLHPDDQQRLIKWLRLSLNAQRVALFLEHADTILVVECNGVKDDNCVE